MLAALKLATKQVFTILSSFGPKQGTDLRIIRHPPGDLHLFRSPTDYKGTDEVASFIQHMMIRNKMAVIDTVFIKGYSQCYTCGYGHDCASGNVVKDHGFLDAILPEHLPQKFSAQGSAVLQVLKAGRILGSILSARTSG
jgi:hypothetical protein